MKTGDEGTALRVVDLGDSMTLGRLRLRTGDGCWLAVCASEGGGIGGRLSNASVEGRGVFVSDGA